jgi:hypothetical protein
MVKILMSSASSASEGTDLDDEIEQHTPIVPKRKGRPPKSASKKLKPVETKEPEDDVESGSDDEFDELGEKKVTKDGFLLGMEFNFGFLEQVLFYRRKGISISNVHTSKTSKSIVSFFTRRLKGIRI